MHAYATNAKDRENIPGYLVVGSVAITSLFVYLVQNFRLPIPWYIDTPAVAGFYSMLLFLFDNYLWRWKLGPIRFSNIPDIGGTWTGKIHSSFRNTDVDVVVHIQQTWSKLSIKLDSQTSTSFTTMASFNVGLSNNSLRYEYQNEGKAYKSVLNYRGAAHLDLELNRKRLKGKYYTSEGSNNKGELELKLVAREYLDSQEAKQRATQGP